MTNLDVIAWLNSDILNEYQHFLFYLHSSMMLTGLERVYLVDILKKHAESEMEHILEFGHKIRSYGAEVVSINNSQRYFPNLLTRAKDILEYAITMEKEVVQNYHLRHEMFEKLDPKDISLLVFIEEQIEHSQHDIDELIQILAGM
jgi:ferritin